MDEIDSATAEQTKDYSKPAKLLFGLIAVSCPKSISRKPIPMAIHGLYSVLQDCPWNKCFGLSTYTMILRGSVSSSGLDGACSLTYYTRVMYI